jgi:hypothetical protein
MPNFGLPDLNLQLCTIQTGEALQSPGINVGAPNHALEPTPNSFRSYVASAIGRGSPPAFGFNGKK